MNRIIVNILYGTVLIINFVWFLPFVWSERFIDLEVKIVITVFSLAIMLMIGVLAWKINFERER